MTAGYGNRESAQPDKREEGGVRGSYPSSPRPSSLGAPLGEGAALLCHRSEGVGSPRSRRRRAAAMASACRHAWHSQHGMRSEDSAAKAHQATTSELVRVGLSRTCQLRTGITIIIGCSAEHHGSLASMRKQVRIQAGLRHRANDGGPEDRAWIAMGRLRVASEGSRGPASFRQGTAASWCPISIRLP